MSSATPNNMPGATDGEPTAEVEPTETETVEQSEKADPDPEKLLELNRSLRKEAETKRRKLRELEQQSSADRADAEKLRELVKAIGGEKSSEFDAKAAYEKLVSDLASERTERLRADVARTTNVDPKYIRGSTEEEMRASAEDLRTYVQSLVDEAAKTKTPAAPPASTVTSNGKISGPQQITSHEQLKSMSHKEIMAADREGRLDTLKGKS